MSIKDIIAKMNRSKKFDGAFNNEILTHMPEIEQLIKSLETMSVDDFCLLQAGITPVKVSE